MSFIPADSISVCLFVFFSLIMFSLISYAVWKTSTRSGWFMSFFCSYLFIFSAIVASGLPRQYPIPTIPILFLSVVMFALLLAFSEFGTKIGSGFSMAALVGFQSFRLPLEIILHHWVGLGTLPATMTWTGQNWDIASGLLAILAIPFVNKNKGIAILAHSIGLLLLFNVIRVVIMSSPFPFSWKLENPIQLIMFLPYALIGPLFVGAALAGHLITLRVLLKK